MLCSFFMSHCAGIHIDRALKHELWEWPMYGKDPSRTNATGEIVRPPLTVAWEQDISAGVGQGSPLLVDSLVVVGTMRGELYAINAFTGKRIGWVDLGESIEGAPVITGNSAIVACSNTQESLSAFDLMEGRVRWKRACGDLEISPLVFDNFVFVANTEGTVFCVDKFNGELVWKFEIPDNAKRNGFRSSPAAGKNLLILGGEDGWVYAFEAATGKLRWRFDTGASIAAPATMMDSIVVIGNLKGDLFAIGAVSGQLLWKSTTEASFYAGPCVTEGLVVIGNTKGLLFALQISDGSLRWKTDLGGVINSSAVAAGPTIYLGTLQKQLFAISSQNGEILWKQETTGRIKTTAAIGNRMLYVVTDEHLILAFREGQP
jgi:outer membrane protein assembly factor BamB